MLITHALHPETQTDGFMTTYIDPFLVIADLITMRAGFNKRRANTGLTPQLWESVVGSSVVDKLRETLLKMGESRKPGDALSPEVQMAQTLGNRVNLLTESVRLSLDGIDADKVQGAEPRFNPKGGFNWIMSSGVWDNSPGAFAEQNFFTRKAPGAGVPFPGSLAQMGAIGELAKQVGIVELAHAFHNLKGTPSFWGPEIFDKGDPRYRIAGMVDMQRWCNVASLGFGMAIQPALLLMHIARRFLFGEGGKPSPVTAHLYRRLDPHSIGSVRETLDKVCESFRIMPIYELPLRLFHWGETTCRWGKMAFFPLPRELEDLSIPALDMLGSDAPFMKLLRELNGVLTSEQLTLLYGRWMGQIGATEPKGGVAVPGPYAPELLYTDGLHCSRDLTDPLQLWLTPMFKGSAHMGPMLKVINVLEEYAAGSYAEARDFDDIPILAYTPDRSELEGSTHELMTPAKWRKLNGDYQGDVGMLTVPNTIHGFAQQMGVDDQVFGLMVQKNREKWAHLFDVSGPDVKELASHPLAFRSIRTDNWWMRNIKLKYAGPSSFRKWIDGERIEATSKLDAKAYLHSMDWIGMTTPEKADLPSTLDGQFYKLITSLGATPEPPPIVSSEAAKAQSKEE